MPVVLFDTLKCLKTLTDAGIPYDQAKAIVTVMLDACTQSIECMEQKAAAQKGLQPQKMSTN